jgi:hypothetical protein
MRLVCVCALVAACGLATASVSHAAIYTDPRIDQIASEASGLPMRAFCYSSFDSWRHEWDDDEGRTMFGAASGGTGQFFVDLSPTVCSTLLAAFDHGASAAGTRWASLAILTLLHASIYQGNVERGFIRGWRYEGTTSCTALKLIPQYAARIGFPEKIGSEVWQRSLPYA